MSATIPVDKLTAIFLDYCGAGEINRIEFFDKDRPIFFSTAKRFDMDAVVAEMNDETQAVYLKPFLVSMRKIDDDLLVQSRQSGVWTKFKGRS